MRLNDLINREIGRYRVEALIGRGGMAAVYRAFDTRLQRHVALKVLYPQYLADDDILERFRREAVTAAQLDHPHIAPIYDVGEADGMFFLTMKLLPGPSLAEVLQREQRLAPERVVKLAAEIAGALDEAHRRGIVHRDIKPGNVLLDERGHAILTDFGIAKSLDAPGLTESSVIVGTPDYIAPEQIDPRLAPGGKLDGRADLYSLGALLYRALTGHRPFDGPPQAVLLAHLQSDPAPPSVHQPDLPPAVDAVFAKALAKRPEARYSSAAELADALALSFGEPTEVGVAFPPAAVRREPHTRPTTQVTNGPASAASDTSQPTAASKPRGRSAVAPLAVVLALVVLVGVGFGLVSFARQQEQAAAVALGSTPTTAALPSPTRTATAQPTSTVTPEPTPSVTSTAPPTQTPTAIPSPTTIPSTTAPSAPTRAGLSVQRPSPVPVRPSATPTNRPTPTPKPTPRPQPSPQPTSRPQPSPQPTSRPQPSPQLPSEPTPIPTARPTEVASLPSCPIKLAGGFGNLWRSNAHVREQLGCPTEPERAGYSVEQMFENGRMYYREERHRFWVFNDLSAGVWREYADVYPSDPDPSEAAPPNLYPPAGGFGKLWQKYPAIRQSLGWATTPQTPFTGVVQSFEGGTLLFAPGVNDHGKQIYALNNNGTYQIYPDFYVGP